MEKITSQNELRNAILQLESKRAEEWKLLKEQFNLAYESIKPINLIKSTLKEATKSPELKDNLLNTTVGLTAGYLSKKLFEGTSENRSTKLFGTALLFGVANAVANNPEVVKSLGNGLLKFIRSKSSANKNVITNNKTG